MTIAKRFIRTKPNTNVALTAVGRERIADRWAQLERLRRLSGPGESYDPAR